MTAAAFDRIEWARKVHRAGDLPRATRAAAVQLVVEMDDHGRLALNLAALAALLGLGEQAVRRHVGALERAGWLSRRRARGNRFVPLDLVADEPALLARPVESDRSRGVRPVESDRSTAARPVATDRSRGVRPVESDRSTPPHTPPYGNYGSTGLRDKGAEAVPAGLSAQLALLDLDEVRWVYERALEARLPVNSRKERALLAGFIAGRLEEGCAPEDLAKAFAAQFDPDAGRVWAPARLWRHKTEHVRPRRRPSVVDEQPAQRASDEHAEASARQARLAMAYALGKNGASIPAWVVDDQELREAFLDGRGAAQSPGQG